MHSWMVRGASRGAVITRRRGITVAGVGPCWLVATLVAAVTSGRNRPAKASAAWPAGAVRPLSAELPPLIEATPDAVTAWAKGARIRRAARAQVTDRRRGGKQGDGGRH